MHRHFAPLLRLFALTGTATLFFSPACLHAQVSPEATRPFSLYFYGMLSGRPHELNYATGIGETFGANVQHSPWIGADFRGVVVNTHSSLHTFAGEAGPRITHRFGAFQGYAEGLGGIAHTGYTSYPNALYTAYGAAWSAAFGADLRVSDHFKWRVADYSYSHVYIGRNGATPSILSTGVVFRLF